MYTLPLSKVWSIQPPSVGTVGLGLWGVPAVVEDQWTKDHLDVQLCEDPSHCLRETMHVGQGYSCCRSPDIHILSV